MGFALAVGLFFISRRLGLALVAYVLVLVCLPRIYLGMHWPSDILAGAALGAAASSALCHQRIRSVLAAPVLKLHACSPAAFCVVALLMSYGVMTRFDNVRSLAAWGAHAVRRPAPEVQAPPPAPHLSQL